MTYEVFHSQSNLLSFHYSATANSIQFLWSQAHIPTGWRLETRLILLKWTLLFNDFAWTTQKTQPLSCWEGAFTTPLRSNGSYFIVACVFVAAGMWLPSRCLARYVFPDFTIPASWRHVTIYFASALTSYGLQREVYYPLSYNVQCGQTLWGTGILQGFN
jgi:hypothetical protein